MEQQGGELDSAFAQAKGETFSRLRGAQSHAFEKATLARGARQKIGRIMEVDLLPETISR